MLQSWTGFLLIKDGYSQQQSNILIVNLVLSLLRHKTYEVEYQTRSQTHSKASLLMEMRTAIVSVYRF